MAAFTREDVQQLLDESSDEDEVIWSPNASVDSGSPLARHHKTRRWHLTISLCYAFFCLGMALSLLGPALLDLAYQTQSCIQEMAYVFTARSMGYLLGSVVGGRTFDENKNPSRMLAVGMLFVAVGGVFLPYLTSVFAIAFLVSFQGFSMGLLDTGGNVLLLQIWGSEVGPVMQALHASFAVGTMCSPLLARPFLGRDLVLPSRCKIDVPCGNGDAPLSTTAAATVVTTVTAASTAGTVTGSLLPATTTAATAAAPLVTTHLAVPFWLVGMACLAAAVSFVYLAVRSPVGGEKSGRSSDSTENQHRREGSFRNWVIGSVFWFLCLYVGLEVAFGAYIYTFAVKYCPLQFSESNAALLNAGFWGAFAVGRVSAIFFSVYVPPRFLVIFDLAGCIFSSSLIAAFSSNASVVWIGTGIFGFSMASVFPSAMHMLEDYIDVTGRTASIIVVGAALGEMAIPLTEGSLLEARGPATFPVINLITAVVAAVFFAVFYRIGSQQANAQFGRATSKALQSRDIGYTVLSQEEQPRNGRRRNASDIELDDM